MTPATLHPVIPADALFQEAIDIAVTLNALRMLGRERGAEGLVDTESDRPV